MMWSNELLPFVVNADITEYDIRRGNTSIMRTFHLAEDSEIEYLESLPKKERNIKVGLLQRERDGFAEQLERGFNEMVMEFLRVNELDQDTDVIAIRRDAVFVVNKPIPVTKIGEYVKFVKKDQYHAYLCLNNKIEMLFRHPSLVDDTHPRYDIDGFVRDSAEKAEIISKLEHGILAFIEEVVGVMEGSNFDRRKIYRFLREFCGYYKRKELDLEYYREFNRQAKFKLRTSEGTTLANFIDETMVEDLDISYNYLSVIIPILQSVIR